MMAAEIATEKEVTDKCFSRCCGCVTEWLMGVLQALL